MRKTEINITMAKRFLLNNLLPYQSSEKNECFSKFKMTAKIRIIHYPESFIICTVLLFIL